MRLAAYQFAVCGDIDHNLEIIKKAIVSASENKVDLIIFPECALTGYPPRGIAGSDRINVNVVSEAIQELQKLAYEARDLYNLVLKDIQELAEQAMKDADAFYQRLSSRMERRYLVDASQTEKERKR